MVRWLYVIDIGRIVLLQVHRQECGIAEPQTSVKVKA